MTAAAAHAVPTPQAPDLHRRTASLPAATTTTTTTTTPPPPASAVNGGPLAPQALQAAGAGPLSAPPATLHAALP
eukprot:scaffold2583_cov140-Isochrysis_galbana.AAC.6